MSRPSRMDDVKVERRRRVGQGSERSLKLHVPEGAKDPNFVYRWVNNNPGRVKQLTEMDDYEVVSASDGKIDAGTSEGTVVKRTVNRTEGDEAILLRKPREYYEADKADEQAMIDQRDEALRAGSEATSEGLSGSEAYVPGGRRGASGRNIVAGK